jgi:energy-coupling factor transporter ATP-binding protein EcfA2
VLTHHPSDPLQMQGGTTFIFVTDGIESALEQAVLARFGLEDAADRLVRTFTGGMRRKLDLGASLVGEPRLLLLDEPTTGDDPRSRIELWDAIRGLVGRGTDVLLTTQYLDRSAHVEAGHRNLPQQPGSQGHAPPVERALDGKETTLAPATSLARLRK